MSHDAETQHYLEKVKQVRNEAKDGQLVKTATRYMTWNEREKKQAELNRTQEQMAPDNFARASITQQGKANITRYVQHLKRDLQANSPPTDLSGATKDALYAEEKRLEADIREGMLPVEVMRRNPTGAVSHHTRWEKEKKEKILAWKNIRRLLNPTDESEDLASVEMIRPSMAGENAAATFMSDAQIPGYFAMSPLAKENWPVNMPEYGTVDSPMKQAERRELEDEERRELEELREFKRVEQERRQSISRKIKEAHRNRSEALVKKELKRLEKEKKQAAETQENADVNL